MPVSRADRERLKGLLAQNGLTRPVWRRMTTQTLKRRVYRIAMNRDPANPCTRFAVKISEEDKAKITEAFISRI